jgi:hypothetical protein
MPGAELLAASRRLLDRIGADLADGRILIARSAAAADRADELSAFDQRKAARRCDEGRIKRSDICERLTPLWPDLAFR